MELKKLSDTNKKITNIVKGSIQGICKTLVECTALDIKESVIQCSIETAKNYIDADSVCIFKIEEHEHIEFGPICTGYKFLIWSKRLNVWISFAHDFSEVVEILDTEDHDTDLGDFWIEPQQYDEDKASADALTLANTSGFGALRNRDQRADFSKKLLKDRKDENTLDYRRHIAAIAETYFDFGILPIESKRLTSEGKTAKEIAAMYGVTKSKVERSFLIEPVDYVKENFNKFKGN